MRSTYDLSKAILEISKRKDSDPTKVHDIENLIYWHIDDALKLIKNINETSTNNQDRANRIIDMENKFGIPKTHLIS